MADSDSSDVTATHERFSNEKKHLAGHTVDVVRTLRDADAETAAADFHRPHGTPPSSAPSKPADVHCQGSNNTTLIPRPSASPDDPLNWSWMKKHAVLLALIPGCLLSDWTLTWGTTVFEMQAPEW
jgi:hypothetical protein